MGELFLTMWSLRRHARRHQVYQKWGWEAGQGSCSLRRFVKSPPAGTRISQHYCNHHTHARRRNAKWLTIRFAGGQLPWVPQSEKCAGLDRSIRSSDQERQCQPYERPGDFGRQIRLLKPSQKDGRSSTGCIIGSH